MFAQARRRVPLLTEARRLHRAFEVAFEPRVNRVTGDLQHMRDWAGKHCGLLVRIARLFALASAFSPGKTASDEADDQRGPSPHPRRRLRLPTQLLGFRHRLLGRVRSLPLHEWSDIAAARRLEYERTVIAQARLAPAKPISLAGFQVSITGRF